MGRIVTQSLRAKENGDTVCEGIFITRYELYGLFLLALTLPFAAFATGLYTGGQNSVSHQQVAEVSSLSKPKITKDRLKENQLATVDSSLKATTAIDAAQPRSTSKMPIQATSQESNLKPAKMNYQEQITHNNLVIESPSPRSNNVQKSENATIYTTTPQSYQYIVQVGLFSDKHSAQIWRRDLPQQFSYWVIPRIYPDGGARFAVIIGLFSNKSAAQDAALDFESQTSSDAFVAELNAQQIEKKLAHL